MKTVIDILKQHVQKQPDQKLLVFHPPEFDDAWTAAMVYERAQALASDLQSRGVRKGMNIGILAPTKPQWEVAQIAIWMTGAVVVGLDRLDTPEAHQHIITVCDMDVVLVSESIESQKLRSISEQRTGLQWIALETTLKSCPARPLDETIYPTPEDPATIIFTSGTTGEPKGIQYTHGQLVYAAEQIIQILPAVQQIHRFASWIPLSSLIQRIANICALILGMEIYFIDNPLEIMDHLPKIAPGILIGVPRFFEKVNAGIENKVAAASTLQRILYRCALRVGRRYSRALQAHIKPSGLLHFSNQVADRFVFKKLRRLFGGNMVMMVSGSAPLRRDILEYYHAIGLLILEVYGTSENVILNTSNRLDAYKFGSVGLPLVPDSIKLSDEGEIWIRGPGVFHGYYKNPQKDMFEQGYYKTGDLGTFDSEGFLHITGRISDVFKTSTGTKIPTLAIQQILQKLPWVDAAITLGEYRKVPTVAVTIDFTSLSSQFGIPLERLWDTANGEFNSEVLYRIETDLRQQLLEIPEKYRPAGVLILPRKFTAQENEMTPNMKLRRKYIEKKFAQTLISFYAALDDYSYGALIWVLDPANIQFADYRLEGPSYRMLSRIQSVIGLLIHSAIVYIRLRVWGGTPDQIHRQMGRIFREGLGGMKGPLHKLGQMLSYVAQDLPEGFRDEIRELVHDSAPVNSHLIRSIVEAELGKPIGLIFREWNDMPLATGSIGQVHWARLPDGQQVVVKVVLPGMDKIVKADMLFLKLVLPFVKLIWKLANWNDWLDELKQLITAECDLRTEVDYMNLYRSFFARQPDLLIPRVFDRYCTKKVLVTEFIEGQGFEEFNRTASQEEKNKAAEILWEYSCEATGRYAVLNADPHPGNYIFKDGKIALIDFGFCKKWPQAFVQNWNAQTLACHRGDFEGFRAASERMGYQRVNGQIDFKALFDFYRNIFQQPWREDADFTFDQEFVRGYLRSILNFHVTVPGLIMPTGCLALTRLYWGLFAVMAELRATANFYRLTLPILEANLPKDFERKAS